MAAPAERILFAIGDIHGEDRKLAALHEAILQRIAQERRQARIIHLGDYVDRGPDSRAVIDRIRALEARFDGSPYVEIVSLMGNHELMMLHALEDPHASATSWLHNGGRQTVESYAVAATGAREVRTIGNTLSAAALEDWAEAVPDEHFVWLSERPTFYWLRDARLVFVHAGINPEAFPNCASEVHLWTRSPKFMDDEHWPDREPLQGLRVVHGHTPTENFQPEVTPRRINVDTGACFGGPLTAVMLKEGEPPEFLQAE